MSTGRVSPIELHLGNGEASDAVRRQSGTVEMSWQRNPGTDGSGVSWSLSQFRTSGPDSVEVTSSRDGDFVFTQVVLKGGFEAELACGRRYQDSAPGLIRPSVSGAMYRFGAADNAIFGALASLETVKAWFGGPVPKGVRPLIEGGSNTYHRARALPLHLRQALMTALSNTSPLGHRMVSAAAQQILGFHLQSLCEDGVPNVTPLAGSLARDAHALLQESPQRPPSLAEIASQFGVSPRRLDRAYQAEFGTSFNRSLQQVRFDAICSALQQGMPIKVVAHSFGYSSVSNFSSAFRRRTGLPPRRWLERQAAFRR
ncbi:helix-turn-helix domain-containing protein [Mameliella sp.]|uniref:helix-turn-helix domain-containing protein n=1 Tax=Mameliella sp. TaxID=1924940 RepID=UPI003BA9D328